VHKRGGGDLKQLDWQGKFQTKCGPGSTTEICVEHMRFITSWEKEGIILEDSEFMATICFESSWRFFIANPRV
jgi:hypothetical protein